MTTLNAEPEPAPKKACGYLIDGTHRCKKKPVVGHLTAEYAAGEQTALCAEHRALFPETVDWNGETITTVEPA